MWIHRRGLSASEFQWKHSLPERQVRLWSMGMSNRLQTSFRPTYGSKTGKNLIFYNDSRFRIYPFLFFGHGHCREWDHGAYKMHATMIVSHATYKIDFYIYLYSWIFAMQCDRRKLKKNEREINQEGKTFWSIRKFLIVDLNVNYVITVLFLLDI